MKKILFLTAIVLIVIKSYSQDINLFNKVETFFPKFDRKSEFFILDTVVMNIQDKKIQFVSDIQLINMSPTYDYLGLDYFYYKLKEKAFENGANAFILKSFSKRVINNQLIMALHCELFRVNPNDINNSGSGSIYIISPDPPYHTSTGRDRISINSHNHVLRSGQFVSYCAKTAGEEVTIERKGLLSVTRRRIKPNSNTNYYLLIEPQIAVMSGGVNRKIIFNEIEPSLGVLLTRFYEEIK